jgi:multisubunit Na+/H+ antiporter MnhE subunit
MHERGAGRVRYGLLLIVLAGFWVLLSGRIDHTDPFDQYLLACGAASVVLATGFALRAGVFKDSGRVIRVILKLPLMLPWFAFRVISANLAVAAAVWNPRSRKGLHARIVRTPCTLKGEFATAMFANFVALTPGRVLVNVDAKSKSCEVCTLHESSAQGLRDIHDRLTRIEGE